MKEFNFSKNVMKIASKPSSIAALIGVIVLIIVLIKIKKVKMNTRTITYIAVAVALSTVLKMFKIVELPQGGSITLGSMVPVFLIAFFYGPEAGFLTGFLVGIIDLMISPYILHPVQVLFDYPLPFMALGIAGYFKNKKILGVIIAVFVRFICHVISGVVFFASYAPKGVSPLWYSVSYNGPFLIIEAAICVAIIAVLPVERIYSAISRKE